VDPCDHEALLTAVVGYLDDADRCLSHGHKARAYAENTFAIDRITDRFEAVLSRLSLQRRSARKR
jgi:hypothetical protein